MQGNLKCTGQIISITAFHIHFVIYNTAIELIVNTILVEDISFQKLVWPTPVGLHIHKMILFSDNQLLILSKLPFPSKLKSALPMTLGTFDADLMSLF
ncbi:MAG: hypothetical protein ACI9DJ_000517 [Algoriphagus sp.]|jgi:hypothetical protein